jgi:hypothetical protein
MEKRYGKTGWMMEGPYRCCQRCGAPQDARDTYEEFCSEDCRVADPTWPTELDEAIARDELALERAAYVARAARQAALEFDGQAP